MLTSAQELFVKRELQYHQGQASAVQIPPYQLTFLSVVARFRPQNKVELASGGEPIVEFPSEDTCSIQVR
jgi:hypothetical protein